MRNSHAKNSLMHKILASAKCLLAFSIILPLLIISTGFAAWISSTPSIDLSSSASIKSDYVIDASALMNVLSFEPHTEQLYYTGPVVNGDIVNELYVDCTIELKSANIYEYAKELPGSIIYLCISLSLSNGAGAEIFGHHNAQNNGEWETHFREVNTTYQLANVMSVSCVGTQSTSASFTIVFALDFSSYDVNTSVHNNLTITPSFVLDANGYPALFDIMKNTASRPTFRLDLRLSENNGLQ